MRAPACNHARAKLPAAQPARAAIALRWMYAIDGVVNIRRFPKPHLVVKARRDGHLSLVAACGVTGQSNLDALQIADAAVAHKLCRVAKLNRGPLLAADLQNASR